MVDFRADSLNRGSLSPVTVHGQIVQTRKAPPNPSRTVAPGGKPPTVG